MQDLTQLAIIVPTYNEAENLPHLIRRIAGAMDGHPMSYEVIIVDDNSPDGTEAVVADLIKEGFPLRLIIRTEERGLSSAVIRGFREAGDADILLCMDGDLSHPPERLPDMIEALTSDPETEFVIGSRYVPGASTDENWGLFRLLNSKAATLLARPFTSVKDPMAGFFAIPAPVFRRALKLNPCGYKIGLELIVKCGISTVAEVPIHFSDRVFGRSKMNFREQLNYLRHIKRLSDFKFGGFSELLQFLAVGATGMAIDLLLYLLLLSGGVVLPVARAIAIGVAMTWNFMLNRRVTFSHARKASILPQYGRYVLSSGFGALISWSVSVGLAYLVPAFKSQPVLAAIIGVAFGTISNFLISKFWVFRKKQEVKVVAPRRSEIHHVAPNA